MNDSIIQAVAIHTLAIAKIANEVVSVHCLGMDFKAMPTDRLEDVMARMVSSQPSKVQPVNQDEWKLSVQPGQVQLNKQWIGKPDPGYRGETRRIIPFDTFEEG